MRHLLGLLPTALLLLAGPAFGDPTPEEAAAVAAKNIAEAEVALLKARMGLGFTPPFTGAVDAGTGAGSIETMLLAADGVRSAAEVIARAPGCEVGTKTVVLLSAGEMPSFNSLISFTAGAEVFGLAYADAKKAAKDAEEDIARRLGGVRMELADVGGIGAITARLAGLHNLLGFLRTDYALKGGDITLDDSMLLHAVAAELVKKACRVRLPAIFNRPALDGTASPVVKTLQTIEVRRIEAVEQEKVWNDRLKLVEDEIKKGGRDVDRLKEIAAMMKAVAEKWKVVAGLHTSLFGKLATPDDKGAVPLVSVIKEAAIRDAIMCDSPPCAPLLLVKSQKAAGSNYTKKNMWTALGFMPFYAAGGAVASFVMFDHAGDVTAAQVVPIHGGYRRADKVEAQFRAPAPAPRESPAIPPRGAEPR